MLYIILFLLTSLCFSQTVIFTDDFGDRVRDGAEYAHWIFDTTYDATIQSDLNGAETLTWNNTNFPIYSQLVANQNPLYEGGNVLQFLGTNDFLEGDLTGQDIYGIKCVFYFASDITNATAFTMLCNMAGNFYGLIFGAFTGSFPNELFGITSASGQRVWNAAATIPAGWHTAFARKGATWEIYIDGVRRDNLQSTDPPIYTGSSDFEIGRRQNNDGFFVGYIAEVKLYAESAPSAITAKEESWLPRKWFSNSGGVTGVMGEFAIAAVTDTLYFDSLLTAGTWTVTVSDSGNSGGETYRILTSADKSTWSDLGSGTAGMTYSETTVTGTGLGYIGLAVSSSADTVFFDDLTVTLQPTTTIGKFKGKHKQFKNFTER